MTRTEEARAKIQQKKRQIDGALPPGQRERLVELAAQAIRGIEKGGHDSEDFEVYSHGNTWLVNVKRA